MTEAKPESSTAIAENLKKLVDFHVAKGTEPQDVWKSMEGKTSVKELTPQQLDVLIAGMPAHLSAKEEDRKEPQTP